MPPDNTRYAEMPQPPAGGIFLPENVYRQAAFVLSLIPQLPDLQAASNQAKSELDELIQRLDSLREIAAKAQDVESTIQRYGATLAGEICRELEPGDYQFGDNCYWVTVDEYGYKRLEGWEPGLVGERQIWYNRWDKIPPENCRNARTVEYALLIQDYHQPK